MQRQDSTEAAQTPQFSMNDAVGNLFQTAVLLLGDEQAAALVVEQAVAEAVIDPCVDLDSKSHELMNEVMALSLGWTSRASAGALDAPINGGSMAGSSGSCIESDDLSASGMSTAQLQEMVDGPGRAKLRQWLEQLSPSLRAVFVLRAILARDNAATAAVLLKSGANGWTANDVSLVYRQALCSLATSLLNSTHPHLVS